MMLLAVLLIGTSLSLNTVSGQTCGGTTCANGGTCIDNVCVCQPGYTGSDCSTDIDECASSPCQNGASCMQWIDFYYCFCTRGYVGVNCETVLGGACGPTQEYLTVTAGSGSISTPNYPGQYDNFLDCRWSIVPDTPGGIVAIQFTAFNMNDGDYVAVLDGPTASAPVESNVTYTQMSTWGYTFYGKNGGVFIQLTTNAFGTSTGFVANYSSVPPLPEECIDGQRPAVRTASTGTIQSFNYPNDYINEIGCCWQVEAQSADEVVRLEFSDFSLAYGDMVVVDDNAINAAGTVDNADKNWFGTTIPTPYYTTQQYLAMCFFTDSAERSRGFSATYTSVPSNCAANGAPLSVVASSIAGTITSPGFPNDYFSSASCSWLIDPGSSRKKVQLTIISFNTESGDDTLKIYNGDSSSASLLSTLSGSNASGTVVLGSKGNKMFIQFVSDSDSNVGGGFSASYLRV